MSATKHLRPAPGLKVRRPDGRHLAEAGETVEFTSYWQRRKAAGDVVEVTEQAKPAAVTVNHAAEALPAADDSKPADEGRNNRKRG